jgi:DNA-binding transcriptional MerR regulator
MKDTNFLSISDFAKLSRLTRAALLHYDRIGLLSPLSRGDNQYRYYSIGQISTVNVIRTLQKLGMSLNEIKYLKEQRTPENTREMLIIQTKNIDAQIDSWINARNILVMLKNIIDEALSVKEESIVIQTMPVKAIIQGELNDYSNGKTDYHALAEFYDDISNKYPDADLNYPVWAIFSEERMRNRDWKWPDRYYFNNPKGFDKKPSALYAIGYMRTGYGNHDALYDKMVKYIDENGYEICGNTYEEYLLNEFCISDESNYLVQVMITVRKIRKNKRL